MWTKLEKMGIRVFCAYIFTETCLHHNIPDQAVALDRRTGRREVDSVFTSLMPVALNAKLIDSCLPDVKLSA